MFYASKKLIFDVSDGNGRFNHIDMIYNLKSFNDKRSKSP